MKNNNYIIVLLLCFTHYKLGILPHVHLLYILSLCTCYNISVATSLTRRVLHCLCECMKIGYIYVILCIVHVQYTPSVSTIKLSGPTYSSQNVRQMSDKFESQHGLSPTIWSDILVGHFGRTWEWILKRFFFYISRGEYVKHFVIDAYL